MSVINNVLKDLESRESRFTPIEIESITPLRGRGFDPKWWLLAGVALGAIFLASWYYLQSMAVPVARVDAVEPNPVEVVQAPAAVASAPVVVAETHAKNQIIGLQIREAESEMGLEFAMRKRVVGYLTERSENRFTYHLRDIDSEIAAPTLRDNGFLTDLEISARHEGVDILFRTVPGVFVETRQRAMGGEFVWAIDLRKIAVAAVNTPDSSGDLAQADAREPIVAGKKQAPASEPMIVDAPATMEPVAETIEPANEKAAPAVRLEIRSINPGADIANRLEYAVTLMQSGRYGDAEALLRDLLDGSADFRARRQLLALYDYRQQHASLAQLARESSTRYPDDAGFRSEYGRALLRQGAYRAVIDLFAGRDRLDASQHALLAASHQRLDQHDDAINFYRLALAQEPREARNWIGLGISQEHGNALADALRSYRAAARLGNLNARLQAFVAKRIDTLQKVLD